MNIKWKTFLHLSVEWGEVCELLSERPKRHSRQSYSSDVFSPKSISWKNRASYIIRLKVLRRNPLALVIYCESYLLSNKTDSIEKLGEFPVRCSVVADCCNFVMQISRQKDRRSGVKLETQGNPFLNEYGKRGGIHEYFLGEAESLYLRICGI